MKTLTLLQGSPEWHAHRATSRNASEASIIMGCSPHMTRAELVRLRATGTEKERSQFVTEVVFNRGHKVEPLLRAYAEKVIGDELYPVVGQSDDGFLSASFDGVTMMETAIFEGKQTNQGKLRDVRAGQLPDEDRWQVVHQFAVCDTAESCIYAVGDGTENGTAHLIVPRPSDADLLALRAAWAQFDADVAAYAPEQPVVEIAARALDNLPSLSVSLGGVVEVISNLPLFEQGLTALIAGIAQEPETDQQFADCKAAVVKLKEAEEALDSAEARALAQIEPVEAMRRKVADLKGLSRTTRLATDKLVKAREEFVRADMLLKAKQEVMAFADQLNQHLAVPVSLPGTLQADLPNAIKGKKTIKGMKDAVAQVVADAKIALTAVAARHRDNLAVLAEAGRPELFGDRDTLVRTKQPEDLRNLAKARIIDAEVREKQRLEAERERIRQEEEGRAQQAAAQLAEQERQRIRDEEAQKLKAQAESQQHDAQWPPQVLAEVEARGPSEQRINVISFGAANETIAGEGPAPTPAPAAAVVTTPEQAPVAADRPGAVVKLLNLGEINARLAPLSITGDGLAALGFQPAQMGKTAKLFREDQFPDMCRAMGRVLKQAIEASTVGVKEAA